MLEVASNGGVTVRARHQAPTLAQEGPAAVVARIAELAAATVAEHGGAAGGVRAVGVGVPGLFDDDDGTAVLLPNLAGDWSGQPLHAPLRSRVGVPVAVVNDARAFTLAETRLGAGVGAATVVGVVCARIWL